MRSHKQIDRLARRTSGGPVTPCSRQMGTGRTTEFPRYRHSLAGRCFAELRAHEDILVPPLGLGAWRPSGYGHALTPGRSKSSLILRKTGSSGRFFGEAGPTLHGLCWIYRIPLAFAAGAPPLPRGINLLSAASAISWPDSIGPELAHLDLHRSLTMTGMTAGAVDLKS